MSHARWLHADAPHNPVTFRAVQRPRRQAVRAAATTLEVTSDSFDAEVLKSVRSAHFPAPTFQFSVGYASAANGASRTSFRFCHSLHLFWHRANMLRTFQVCTFFYSNFYVSIFYGVGSSFPLIIAPRYLQEIPVLVDFYASW